MNIRIILFTAGLVIVVSGQNATVPAETTTIAPTSPAITVPLTTTQEIVTANVVTISPEISQPQETTVIIGTSTESPIPLQDSTISIPLPIPLPIPVDIVIPVRTTPQTVITDATPTENDRCRLLIAIKPGDTFNALAKQHKVKVRDLIRSNPLLIPKNLVVGSTVCIPK